MSDQRYTAHARRAETLRGVSDEPLASYWTGYRQGMARGPREALTDAETAIDAHVAAALAGDDESAGLETFARWCGYHDGRVWADVTQHRGLLRLAITVGGQSNRAFALSTLRMDDAIVRQWIAGSRPISAKRYTELLDLVAALPDDEA